MLRVKSAKLRKYLAGAADARSVQRRNLLDRISRNSSSQFGRDHGFGEIRSVADFRRRVPLGDYEHHRPYIDRVMSGEVTALFAPGTRIRMYAETSGTTAAPKSIPVTENFYRQYKAGWQAWGTGVYADYPHLIHRQTLQFTSHWKVRHAPDGNPCGNISGLAAETRPFYMSSLFVLPKAVIQIHDHAAKHYVALRLSLASDRIGMIITANPSTLVEVAKRADAAKERLIRDIHDGTLDASLPVPDSIRRSLRHHLRPNPRRARELQRVADAAGRLLPKDAWPGLEMIAVWTGGSVGLYLDQLAEYYGDTAIRDHGISASEGRMTLPLRDGCPEGPLDYSSHFYEFIPEAEKDCPDPTVLEAHELIPGHDYYILLTTEGGLYRYDIHDLVRCHGFEGQTPMLSFLNKGKHYASFTGEKLFEHQVTEAMRLTCQTLDLQRHTFTLAPTLQERLRYTLVITDQGSHKWASPGCGDELAREFQRRLAAINHEYGDKCDSGRIEPLTVMTVPAEAWTQLRHEKSRQRGNFEEYKHPCLTSDLAFLPQLTAIVERLPAA